MAYNPFRHFWLKAVAVGIATLLWVAVGGEKIVERSLLAPLELQNRPKMLEVVGEAPSTADVRVRGTSTALARLAPGDVTAVLDVATAKPGPNFFHLAPDHVRAPFGVEVSYAGPATVQLVFERHVVKRVPVVAPVTGDPAPGYEKLRVAVEPAEVEIEGPESAVADVTQATTEPVELKASAAQVRQTVAIGILNSAVRLRSQQRAVVTVDIQPVRTERTIGAVPVRMHQLRAGQRTQSNPPNVAITVRADDEVLNRLGVGAIEASVDVAGLGAGRYTLPVRVAPSRLFGLVRVDPPQVTVTIR
ncbi:MAG: CdaR family protein [Vicinamibacterales bacterium]